MDSNDVRREQCAAENLADITFRQPCPSRERSHLERFSLDHLFIPAAGTTALFFTSLDNTFLRANLLSAHRNRCLSIAAKKIQARVIVVLVHSGPVADLRYQ
jgi:hypothetical protein